MNNTIRPKYKLTSIKQQILEPIETILQYCCEPYLVPELANNYFRPNKEVNNCSSVKHLTKLFLDPNYNLRHLLYGSTWLDNDVRSMVNTFKNNDDHCQGDSLLGKAFYQKYGNLPYQADARSVATDWQSDLTRALSHLSRKVIGGRLLHIGADKYFEIPTLHPIANSVVLVDIAKDLLTNVLNASPSSKAFHTKAEELVGIDDKSIDFIVALRVFSSTAFNAKKAVQQMARVINYGGSVLISLSNGYKAIDYTILPGQVVNSPPIIDLSRPFEEALNILSFLYNAGFRELFLVPGSTELFCGGTYLNYNDRINGSYPVLHTEKPYNIPLCFYSESMPTSWLCNYSPHPIKVNNVIWPTVEHFFQAEKFKNPALNKTIRLSKSPQEVKDIAWFNNSEIRCDWSTQRVHVMRKAVQAKFDQHPVLRMALLNTMGRDLIEQSPSDTFWGRSLSGEGLNMMGEILMSLRKHYNKGNRYEA